MIVDEHRRRNDEAVRRLREESRLRVERGRATGPTRCMLGTMLALLMFVALESRRMHWQEVALSVPQTRAEAGVAGARGRARRHGSATATGSAEYRLANRAAASFAVSRIPSDCREAGAPG